MLIQIHEDGDYIEYACWVSEYNGLVIDLEYKNDDYPDYSAYEDDIFWIMPDTSSIDSDLIELEDFDNLDMPIDEWLAKNFGV